MVHDQNLLVVRPEESSLSNLIGRALDKDVRVKVEQRVFSVRGVDGDRGANVTIHDNKNFDSLLGLSLEETIETPFLRDGRGASKILQQP